MGCMQDDKHANSLCVIAVLAGLGQPPASCRLCQPARGRPWCNAWQTPC